jgi:LysR family nitrogen assimilation transcriptional regulator
MNPLVLTLEIRLLPRNYSVLMGGIKKLYTHQMKQPVLDVRRLRYFSAIAEHGSLTAAARVLNIAQPALSHHVAELEKDLRAPLLRRLPSGVELTPLGRSLFEYGQRILDLVAEAEDALRMQVSLPTPCTTLRLAIIPSLASTVTPALVAAFATHLPNTVLRIIDARTELARDLIDSDRADIAIHLVSPSDTIDEPLAWENLHWVRRVDADPVTGPVPFREVAAARLILPSAENPLRRYLQSVAQETGVHLDIAMEVDGPDPRKQAVIAGLGTTVFGTHSVANGALGPFLADRLIVDPLLRRPIVMEARKGFDPDLRRKIHAVLTSVLSH